MIGAWFPLTMHMLIFIYAYTFYMLGFCFLFVLFA